MWISIWFVYISPAASKDKGNDRCVFPLKRTFKWNFKLFFSHLSTRIMYWFLWSLPTLYDPCQVELRWKKKSDTDRNIERERQSIWMWVSMRMTSQMRVWSGCHRNQMISYSRCVRSIESVWRVVDCSNKLFTWNQYKRHYWQSIIRLNVNETNLARNSFFSGFYCLC